MLGAGTYYKRSKKNRHVLSILESALASFNKKEREAWRFIRELVVGL